jgi:Fe-S cluster biogenesis protein NfuA
MLRPAIHNYGGFVQVVSVNPEKGQAVIKYKGPAPIASGVKATIAEAFPDIVQVFIVDEHYGQN